MEVFFRFIDHEKERADAHFRNVCLAFSIATVLGLILFCVVSVARAEEITASYYSVASCKREGTWQKYGGRMANGRRFIDEQYTCASWDFRFGTLLRITNTANGRSVVVEVTDRGPAKRLYKKGRVVDLSKGAFSAIADLKRGIIPIKVEVVKLARAK